MSDPHVLVTWVKQIARYPAASDPHVLATWVKQIARYPAASDPHVLVTWVKQIARYPAVSDPHVLVTWVKQIARYPAARLPQGSRRIRNGNVARPASPPPPMCFTIRTRRMGSYQRRTGAR